MASVNKVIIIGSLGADPETRHLASGNALTSMRVATSSRYKDKQSGEMREDTEWHSISLFGRLAEIAGQYLKKGSQVYIEGSLRTRQYKDRNGVEKYATDIIADDMQMLSSRQGETVQNANVRQESQTQHRSVQRRPPLDKDVIPF